MMASVAFFAPSTPPLTGQSRKPAPMPARRLAAARAVSAATVEQSMTMAPAFSVGADRIDDGEQVLVGGDAGDDDVAGRGELGRASANARQPVSEARAVAFDAVRFQAPASRPARCRLRAMCWPMAPRPMNPAFMAGPIVPAARDQLQ